MTDEKILNLLESIKEIVIEISLSGLSFMNESLFQRVDVTFHQASKNKLYRIAASLRYIRTELRRFQKDPKLFNMDRYSFFLTQAWLLAHRLIFEINNGGNKAKILELMGQPVTPIKIDEISLRLVGAQKHYVENSVMGYSFYFVVLDGKLEGKIVSWDYLRGVSRDEILDKVFTTESGNYTFLFHNLLFRNIMLENVTYSASSEKLRLDGETKLYLHSIQPWTLETEKEFQQADKGCNNTMLSFSTEDERKLINNLVFEEEKRLIAQKNKKTASKKTSSKSTSKKTTKKPKVNFDKINPYQKLPVYIKRVELFDSIRYLEKNCIASVQMIVDKVSDYAISPMDTIYQFKEYILLRDCTIEGFHEDKETRKNGKKTWSGRILNNERIQIELSIEDSIANKSMIDRLLALQDKKTLISHFFGYYYIDNSKILFTPLGGIAQRQEFFPGLTKRTEIEIKRKFVGKIPNKPTKKNTKKIEE